MSNTPEADALEKLGAEGLNDQALSELAEIALRELKASMPGLFDENGMPYRHFMGHIPTSHEPYFKDNTHK